MPDTVINSKIYKKTGTNTYVLYHPETGAEQVIYTKTWDSKNYGTISAILDDITLKLDGVGGVLEFCGSATSLADASSKAGVNAKGEVYVITSSFTWDGQTYPENTLIVFTVDDPSATPTDAQFVPLGGSNSAYATKTEAIHTIVGDSTGLKFGYASEANATHSVEGVSTIGTTAVSTLGIVSTIPTTGSDSSIPNVQAVRDFAGSAGKLNTSAATAGGTYYFVAVDSATATNNQVPYNTGFAITLYTQVASGAASAWANLQVKQADRLTKGFSIGDQFYNGDNYMAVTTPSAGEGGLALTYTQSESGGSTTVGVSVALPVVATSGVYSAVQVDVYGRATAGAQSLVFANSLQDPDLNQLVVGGLAFVSSSEIAKSNDDNVPTNSINLNN